MEHAPALASITDDDLLRSLRQVLTQSRRVEADLVAHIGEVDARRLFAREAASSMFVYCTESLHLSEAEAYLRITTARAARAHPVLFEMLRDGRLHLSGIAKLARHLTVENRDVVLARAAHRSKREIEELAAELAPRPDVPTTVRALPRPAVEQRPSIVPTEASLELRPDGVASEVVTPHAAMPSPRQPAVQPLAPSRYKVQFTASDELVRKLDRLKALNPGDDLAVLIEQAVTEKLDRLEARRFAKATKPRKAAAPQASSRSRYIPASVRRAVHERDGGRCRFVDGKGHRCTARDHLEFHHRRPFGYGGGHDPDNVCLMCRAHNAYSAEVDFGKANMARARKVVSERPAIHPA